MLPLPAALVNSVSAFDKIIPHLRKTLSQKPPSCVAWRRSQTDYIFSVCFCHLFLFVQKKCGNNNKNLNSSLSFRILTDSPLYFWVQSKNPRTPAANTLFLQLKHPDFSHIRVLFHKAFQKTGVFLIAFRKTTRAFQKNRRFFNCFLQNTKSISKIRTFFILVIINNGGCKKLAPLTAPL